MRLPPVGRAVISYSQRLPGFQVFDWSVVITSLPGASPQSYRLRSQMPPATEFPSVTSAHPAPCPCTVK